MKDKRIFETKLGFICTGDQRKYQFKILCLYSFVTCSVSSCYVAAVCCDIHSQTTDVCGYWDRRRLRVSSNPDIIHYNPHGADAPVILDTPKN